MKILRLHSTGTNVRKWQLFLSGEGYHLSVDGKFGTITERHTKAFQQVNGLTADGVVGSKTYAKAFERGMHFLADPLNHSETSLNWPPKPDFSFLGGTINRQTISASSIINVCRTVIMSKSHVTGICQVV